MAFDDRFRLSAHAVILNPQGKVLLLRASYGAQSWGLPGGALEPGESVHNALKREALEELGAEISVFELTGVYHHRALECHALIFRCQLPESASIKLSSEHTDFDWFPIEELSPVQARRVKDCIEFDGCARSAVF